MLLLENIEKTYKLQNGYINPVIKGISLNFNKGEFITILGESGSGKSTLLNIIGGLDSDFMGEYKIDNQNSHDINWDCFRKTKIGFIFQNFNLISNITVLENIEIAMTVKGITKKERNRKAKEILTRVGLGEHLDKKPDYLSGGEQQRVAIARALVNNPDIIIADEPTGQLDTDTAREILNLIKELCKNKLVIMATHMEEDARLYATRIVRIVDGRISGEEILKTVKISDEFYNEEYETKKVQFKDLFFMALKNVFSRKRLVTILLLVMIICMSTFLIILGIGIGERENINQIISRDYDIDKFVIYSNSKKTPEYREYREQLESIAAIKNIYFITLLIPTFGFNEGSDIKDQLISDGTNYGQLMLETILINNNTYIEDKILAGNYPNNKNEALIGKKTAISLIFDYYDKNNMDKNKIKAMSNKAILTEIKLINIAYFTESFNNCPTCYQFSEDKYLRFYRNDLIISGIVDDDKLITSTLNTDNTRLFVTKDLFYEIENQYYGKPKTSDIMDYYQPVVLLIEIKNNDYQLRIGTIKQILKDARFNYFSDPVDNYYDYINRNSLFMLNVGIIFSVIIFLISTMITGGIIFTSIRKRTREFGTLFALGYERKTIKKLLYLEGITLSFLGLIITFVVTISIKIYLNNYFNNQIYRDSPDYQKLNIIPIKWYLVLIVFVLLIIAYALPIRKFKKLPIIDALREE